MPKYANITATLALFVALGGTATAAGTLGRDSVGAREIAKDAVRSSEIQTDAVRSLDIQDNTIRINDINEGTRRKLQGPQGPVGPQGPAGPEGPTGTSEVRFVEDDEAAVPDCSEGTPFECPNVQSVLVTRGSWLVQAKFSASDELGIHRCALVTGDGTTIDEAGDVDGNVSLADVLTVSGPTRVGLRCTELLPLTLSNAKLTALAVDEAVAF